MDDAGGETTERSAYEIRCDSGQYLGWMHGFPHAVKDLSAAKGLPFTSGSPMFADRIAEEDDLFVRRIKSAGAI
ncbi:amidase family protein, partial [Klebsiella pneumoniae]|uniref:amidase family protein n=1 Tax=Klebsiella pneumoniae TaxID=573 RepID=UPI0034DDE80A